MRLGQLARKISIRQSDMVDFLAKSGISIVNESNARLEDEHVKSILQHFAPSLEEVIEVAEPAPLEETIQQPVMVEAVEGKEAPQESSVHQIEIPAVEAQNEEKIEVIKAPKVDLPGLKVLGKIDLPEAKKKEVLSSEEDEKVEVPLANTEVNPKPRIQRTRNVQDNRRERPNNRSSINPIALQRERDARAAEAKRRDDAIREKEKRTEYYLNKVKPNAPTKAARIYSEPVEEFTGTKKEEPKTLLGRFFRWLTTA